VEKIEEITVVFRADLTDDLDRDADRSASRGCRDQQRLVRSEGRQRWQSSKR
jgi:hypothetical protein